jgi:hypothetical protein
MPSDFPSGIWQAIGRVFVRWRFLVVIEMAVDLAFANLQRRFMVPAAYSDGHPQALMAERDTHWNSSGATGDVTAPRTGCGFSGSAAEESADWSFQRSHAARSWIR